MKIILIALVLVLAGPTQSLAGHEDDPRVSEALQRGMDYMIRSASDEQNFEEYASDYLFFFADVARLDDPWIAWQAQVHGLKLGQVYLEKYFDLQSADEIVDAASALYALDSLGMDVTGALVLLRQAAPRFPVSDYLGFKPELGQAPDLDSLIDLVIGFHFTDRMAVPIGVTYAEVLPYVASVSYDIVPWLDQNHHIDVNNLVTHLVYTVSGYASWNLPPALMSREIGYFRTQMAYTLCWADPESLSEYVDSLKLFGYGPEDPDIAAGVEVLLSIQTADGRWEPVDAEDEYDRYHATWCAMDALRDYDLEGEERVVDEPTRRILQAWAEQLARGESLRPYMEIGPDPPDDE